MKPNAARQIIGLFVLVMTAAVVWGLFMWEIPEANRDIAYVLLGTVMGWAGSIVSFHYGTSEGSKTKTSLLAVAQPVVPPNDDALLLEEEVT